MTWILVMFITSEAGHKLGVRFDDTNYKSKASCEVEAKKLSEAETNKMFSFGCVKGEK